MIRAGMTPLDGTRTAGAATMTSPHVLHFAGVLLSCAALGGCHLGPAYSAGADVRLGAEWASLGESGAEMAVFCFEEPDQVLSRESVEAAFAEVSSRRTRRISPSDWFVVTPTAEGRVEFVLGTAYPVPMDAQFRYIFAGSASSDLSPNGLVLRVTRRSEQGPPEASTRRYFLVQEVSVGFGVYEVWSDGASLRCGPMVGTAVVSDHPRGAVWTIAMMPGWTEPPR
jgi:hypothetical protein